MSLPDSDAFLAFLAAFFDLFTQKNFSGSRDFPGYIADVSPSQRGGDEASIVDTAITGPLLGLLGFEPAERVYNQQKAENRPDFAPRDAAFGTCFLAEDKNTTLDLDLDLLNPNSHLRQLARYVQASGRQLGWLTNGRRFTAWRFEGIDTLPIPLLDLDMIAAIGEWAKGGPSALPAETMRALSDLWQLFRKTEFAEPARLEKELAVDEETWRQQARALGGESGNERLLVEALQTLVRRLFGDARRTLNEQLDQFAEYEKRQILLSDDSPHQAAEELGRLRESVLQQMRTLAAAAGFNGEEISKIEGILRAVEQDARAYLNPVAVRDAVLNIMDDAMLRKYGSGAKKGKRSLGANERDQLANRLDNFSETAFAFHQRQAGLRQKYRRSIALHDDFRIWQSLVQETMLGDLLTEEQRRDEFALQAAYVIFIRLLLIRVCEDKGIFPQRFLTDGGFKHWQEDIERYLKFANGNPYEPLLDMAYRNAQNIYAHFFTGRELFNWFTLDRANLILTLHELARFDFADVDSDIVGDVYNTYLNRKEKKKRGQYYTPPEIVNYILDTVGYVSGPAIIGPNRRLLDPACGSGKFLVLAAKRLVDAYQRNSNDPAEILQRVRNSLFGFDLNPFACYLAEVNLLIQTLPLVKAAYDLSGRPPQLDRFHIYNVDALARPERTYFYAQMGTLMAEEQDEVNKIKSRASGTPYASGFAFVVANPPYGAKLTSGYKTMLKEDYPDVFRGQPDTYVFFFKRGLELLAANGKLGYITPNTFLMGTNTNMLRERLLNAGRIEQIVDLPQGIWDDATVDCVLTFLTIEPDAQKRREQQVKVNLLGLRDSLDKLTNSQWQETLLQGQDEWLFSSKREMNIRNDYLLSHVENACSFSPNPDSDKSIPLLLGDLTDSSMGIKPFEFETDRINTSYIKPYRDVPISELEWKPFLDGNSFVGRYEIRWAEEKPFIKYGDWLSRPRDRSLFENPKLVIVRFRNKALKRRLVAAYDDSGFFVGNNYSVIRAGAGYEPKYLLAVVNSSVLNFWYARRNDQVSINPAQFRALPIYPADAATQAEFVKLVDDLLAKHAELNRYRADGYLIRSRIGKSPLIEIPFDQLLAELQKADPDLPTRDLFDARAAGLFTIPERCDLSATISSNVYIPDRYPETVVLRHNKLWLAVTDSDLRRYLLGYLGRPQWQGRTYDAIKNHALIPDGDDALNRFFEKLSLRTAEVRTLLEEAATLDQEIDEKVLDLYKITDPTDRLRILGSAPVVEEEETIPVGATAEEE